MEVCFHLRLKDNCDNISHNGDFTSQNGLFLIIMTLSHDYVLVATRGVHE